MTTALELSTEVRQWPAGSHAWFVCRAKGLVADIMVPLIPAATASEATIASKLRMAAARRFKRENQTHPCIKVDCEFQAVETPADRLTQGGAA